LSSLRPLFTFLLVTLLSGCGDEVTTVFTNCNLDVTLTPSSGFPGDVIVATGTPFTSAYDTLIQVGGFNADVLLVERTDCTACDACRPDRECSECGSCIRCEVDCDLCVETITFIVPDAPAGLTVATILNLYGTTGPVPFEILGTSVPDDTGLPDTGGSTDTDVPNATDTASNADSATDTDSDLDSATGIDSDLGGS
jgi:hypothetical protein